MQKLALAAILAAGTTAASAGTVVFDDVLPSSNVTVQSGTVGGIFSQPAENLAQGDLDAIAGAFGPGISLAGHITFFALDTTDGLAIFGVVGSDGDGDVDEFNLSTAIDAPATFYYNDYPTDSAGSGPAFEGVENAIVDFEVGGGDPYDGFAWAGLSVPQSGGTITLTGDDYDGYTYQFVSYVDGAWTVVGPTGQAVAGGQAVGFTVIPLPSATGMGLAGLALVGARRRRA